MNYSERTAQLLTSKKFASYYNPQKSMQQLTEQYIRQQHATIIMSSHITTEKHLNTTDTMTCTSIYC